MDASVAEPPTLACALAVEERAAVRAGARSRRVGLGARERIPEGRLVSFGLAGALVSGLEPGTLLTARRVVDAEGTVLWEDEPLRVPGALTAIVCDAGRIVDDPVERRELARSTGAAAVDTESATLAATGRLAGVVRAISDTPEQPVGRLAHAATRDGAHRLARGRAGSHLGAARDAAHRPGHAASAREPPQRRRRARLGGGTVSKRVLVASPRSFCAGVVRAIDIVEELLKRHGPPVYVRHEIVHNVHVVRDLEERGAVFVKSEEDVPEGALVVLSAHGVAPKVYEKCAERGPPGRRRRVPARLQGARGGAPLRGAGATRSRSSGTRATSRSRARWARRPDSIVLVETPEDVEALELEEGQRLAYLTQTTLSLDDTAEVVDALRERVPDLVGPPSADICYATQNRQDAVKHICDEATLVLVVGSKASSNANRLVEVAHSKGADAYLIDDETDLELDWLEGHETVGLTAGASSPEVLVERVVDRLAELGFTERENVEIAREDVFFRLPASLR